jgi:hypothetical protein
MIKNTTIIIDSKPNNHSKEKEIPRGGLDIARKQYRTGLYILVYTKGFITKLLNEKPPCV